MTVTNVHKDLDSFTLTIEAEYTAPVEAAWELWADPRKLERWWGPPTYPATVVEHELTPGGSVKYFMTGPEGDQHHGWWRIVSVDAPTQLVFDDGFGDADGNENHDLPVTRATATLTATEGGGSKLVLESVYPSREALEQVLAMGMEEGITLAMGQQDALLS